MMPVLNRSFRRFLQAVSRTRNNACFSTELRSTKSRDDFIGGLLLGIPVLSFCLGTWQVKRRKWKLGLIEELQTKKALPPVPLSTTDSTELEEYCKVKVNGKFDHSKEMYIRPRQLFNQDKNNKGGGGSLFSSATEYGAQIVTPFYCTELGTTILVNRGWVPTNKLRPETRIIGQVADEVTVVGFVRSTEKRPPFGEKNDVKKNFWYFRDQEAMAEYGGAVPVLIDSDLDSSTSGGPIGGQTRFTLRNEHLQYIATWYGLSIATSLMWYFGIFKKRKVL